MAWTYHFLLPSLETFASVFQAYDSIPVFDIEDEEDEEDDGEGHAPLPPEKGPHLTRMEKLDLAKPLFVRYMLPLFFVYLAGESHILYPRPWGF